MLFKNGCSRFSTNILPNYLKRSCHCIPNSRPTVKTAGLSTSTGRPKLKSIALPSKDGTNLLTRLNSIGVGPLHKGILPIGSIEESSRILRHVRTKLLVAPQNSQILPTRLYSSSTGEYDGQEIYKEVADLIHSKSKNILIMVGAGISTPSGIPDFRSPGTGLYDNLQKYNLPYPEAIFDIHYFMMDPRPFVTLAQDLYPGVKYYPNIVHYFLRMIYENKNLLKVYTQNIDGLERMAGIPEDKLLEAHGTFATASCTLCSKMHEGDKIKEAILNGEIPKCEGSKCKGKVKPDIVFFGENLPQRFWDYQIETHFCDLLIVIGTSLEVYPFAGIADSVSSNTKRILINREQVGSFGSLPNDYMLLGDLEEVIKRLGRHIGWNERLDDLVENSSNTIK